MAVQSKKVQRKKAPKKAVKKAPAKARKAAPKPTPKKKARVRKPVTGLTGAPLGNQFWKMRSSHGRKPIFDSPEKLWAACVEYFEWVEANPLKEEKVFCHQGHVTKTEVSKMRAMTMDGLYTFIDICAQTWVNYRSRDELSATTEQVERVIRDYKFTGAASELLSPIIIMRDLGLRDGLEHTGKDGGPISGVLAVPTSPDDWATIAMAHQNALKQDAQ